MLQFRQRIPLDVREKAVNSVIVVPVGDTVARCQIGPRTETVQFSLRTRDPAEAKVRHTKAEAFLDAHWAGLRQGTATLTYKQIHALAGEMYCETVSSNEDEPGDADLWEALLELDELPDVPPASSTLSLLARHGIVTDAKSIKRLEAVIHGRMDQAFTRLKGNADGDYSPDPLPLTFPTFEAVRDWSEAKTGSQQSVSGLLEGWWTEAQSAGRSRRTHQAYQTAVSLLVEFLGHDDAQRVTRADIVRFKDKRLADGVSPRTVKDSNLAGLRTVFGWGVDNGLVPENPTDGVRVQQMRRVQLRERSLTAEEAKAILDAARSRPATREHPQTQAAKLWVPWLAAFTGARVGELVQLRKVDVRNEGGLPFIRITPEAGPVKTGMVRDVPLHPQLVGLGFMNFVDELERPRLFLSSPTEDDISGVLEAAKNRLREFVRTVVADPNVQPMHGFRHRFKTLGREVGISEAMLDALCGHAPGTVGATYGHFTLKAKSDAVAKLPHIREYG